MRHCFAKSVKPFSPQLNSQRSKSTNPQQKSQNRFSILFLTLRNFFAAKACRNYPFLNVC
jgi:hypothetical protein